VLHDVSFYVGRGEFVFLTGPTGAGKTTIFKHIYMSELPTLGQVVTAGYNSSDIKKNELPYLRRKIGVVFQDFKLFLDRNVFENVAFTLQVTGYPRRLIKRRVFHVLADLGLSHRRYEMPQKLSGGEQQRVCIARALVGDPYILLADEPTGNLDIVVAREIMEILKEVNSRGTTIMMATHNVELIKQSTFRRIQIAQGDLVGQRMFP